MGRKGDAPNPASPALRLEAVDDPAEGLDAGAVGLPVDEAAEVAALHQVHAAVVVGLLVQDPPKARRGVRDWVLSRQRSLSSALPGNSSAPAPLWACFLPRGLQDFSSPHVGVSAGCDAVSTQVLSKS